MANEILNNDQTPRDTDNGSAHSTQAGGRPSYLVWLGAALVAVLVAVFVVGGLGGSSDDAATADGTQSGIHTIPFTTADGGTATLASYDGEPLVVNFFAAWCPPCRAELPDFQAVHEEYDGDVTFVGISHDFDESQWKGLIAETGVTFDTVFQPGQEIWTEAGGIGMPTTIFISPDGEVLEMHSGILTAEQLSDLIDEHLA